MERNSFPTLRKQRRRDRPPPGFEDSTRRRGPLFQWPEDGAGGRVARRRGSVPSLAVKHISTFHLNQKEAWISRLLGGA